ncbi:hypothetical protein F2P81_009911 [Scophthalmus maximus]|uniref:Uncharacterized protein n=1 Tax=Scophthalmus maximus TaxID=52904 RepID=A0A6A4SUA2_SCOMX|nr:hypothetical protein F2P81_009911 [Scophthalmus maximus]
MVLMCGRRLLRTRSLSEHHRSPDTSLCVCLRASKGYKETKSIRIPLSFETLFKKENDLRQDEADNTMRMRASSGIVPFLLEF